MGREPERAPCETAYFARNPGAGPEIEAGAAVSSSATPAAMHGAPLLLQGPRKSVASLASAARSTCP